MEGKQIECGGFTFLSDFDSANLSRVELVTRKPAAPPEPPSKPSKKPNTGPVNQYPKKKTKSVEFPDYEFNIWTNPDCSGTEFENGNRTWFYFGMTGGTVFSLVKLNVIDLNKQSKMYSQGMAPVYKIIPGKCQWERIRDKPVFTSENNVFTLSFKFRTTENVRAITYFAFTYPFSYVDLQKYLGGIDLKMSKQQNHLPKSEIKSNKGLKIINDINDAIYYHREVLCHSLEQRDVDLITISSHHNITAEREPRLEGLFPNENNPRPFRFQDKKVIFISARVHPGETPSSFVMNGILNLLIQKDDPIAILLRRQFVFKLIPMLNPDGVARGHYRTDTRGCNLNRYYLNPSRELHPSVFGARALIRYHHFGEETVDDFKNDKLDVSSQVDPNELSESDISSIESPKPGEISNSSANNVQTEISDLMMGGKQVLNVNLTQDEFLTTVSNPKSSTDSSVRNVSAKSSNESVLEKEQFVSVQSSEEDMTLLKDLLTERDDERAFKTPSDHVNKIKSVQSTAENRESGLFLYLDMHGHASKKGVFMYGNHFNKTEDSVECMLFPKLMSVNSQNFHFAACNFTEKNMYLRDKRDGTSREGSGRVAVLRLTGLIRSYTLECNYNTGRFVNKLPQCSRDLPGKTNTNLIVPPKYSPVVYEEIGRALCISILDLTNSNPWSRIPNSEYHTLYGIRDWLRLKTLSESFLYHRPVPRQQSKQPSKSSQTQVMMGVVRSGKLLSNVLLTPLHSKTSGNAETKPEDVERKENLAAYRGTSCNSLVMNRKEAGPSHVKRSMGRVSSVLQVRSGGSRSIKSLKKTIYRSGEKLQKLKGFGSKPEGSIEEPSGDGESRVMTHGESERRGKVTSSSEQCLFKQSPKRLKISKGDEGSKPTKVSDWSKEDAIPGTSSSDILLYSRLNRPVSSGESQGKKRTTTPKGKQQLSSVKFKKSLEKRRGSDASRKKSKTLFKKSGKIILTNDSNKGSIDRKRRKN